MLTQQGDLALLGDPTAQKLLHSAIPARLAYVWKDGTPRVVPIWFHWTGEELVLGTPSAAPKTLALTDGAKVAVTIDDLNWPYKVLLIRGTVHQTTVNGVAPEYAAAAERYFGPEQGPAWVAQIGVLSPRMVRIAIRPEWAGILDFEQRFPSAIEKAMAQGAAT